MDLRSYFSSYLEYQGTDSSETFLAMVSEKYSQAENVQTEHSPNKAKPKLYARWPDLSHVLCQATVTSMQVFKGQFFMDEDENRCVWAEDIHYYKSKRVNCEYHEEVSSRSKSFVLAQRNLDIIDQPKAKRISAMVGHVSEPGWSVPKGHETHLLSFPSEILDQILFFALVAPTHLQPDAVSCNWKQAWIQPEYILREFPWIDIYHRQIENYEFSNEMQYTARVPRDDEHGEYTELHKVKRCAIDATVLRTNKNFYERGIKMLYSQDTFIFPMANQGRDHSSPSLLVDLTNFRKRIILHPDPRKPFMGDSFETLDVPAVDHAFLEISGQAPINELQRWVYYDPFLRWLHMIRPKNAALIETLSFTGIVKLHTCMRTVCSQHCDDDLAHSLKLYFPIISQMCPQLKTLIIYAQQDVYHWKNTAVSMATSSASQDYPWDLDHEENMAKALQPLLESQLSQTKSLTDIKVYTERGSGINGQPKWALSAIEAVRKRASARAAEMGRG